MTDLLFELFTTLTGERDLLSAIQAFFFLTSKPMTEGAIATQYGGSYDAIRARAPQLAPIMDEFLAAHGGLAWNAQTYKYNFSSAQSQALFPVEDINSTRRYCVLPGINIQQTLTNIARTFVRWGTSSGEIASMRAQLAEAMSPRRGRTKEGKDKSEEGSS
jgi:hypothetical protein